MPIEPVIAYRNLDPSPAVEAIIPRRMEVLERISDRITGADITMEAPQKRKRHGRVLRVKLHLHVPGPDVAVAREVAQGSARDDLLLALNRAFSAAEKALKRHKKTMAGLEVKHHAPVLHGEVTLLERELGYGYLRADDGREVYFQRDSLGTPGWDRLDTGTRLRFREMQGDKGPYAVGVALAE